MEQHERVLELAEAQWGLVSRHQAVEAGWDEAGVRSLVRSGEWAAWGRRVLARRGVPASVQREAMGAVLAAGGGAVLSGASAAALWQLPGFELLPAEVARRVPAPQTTVLRGIPVVRPGRLAFELFATMPYGRAERAVENAWARGLLDGRTLRVAAAALGGSGRAGTAAVRQFLAAHPLDWVPPASGLESRFQALSDRHDLGRWRRQVSLGGEDGWTGRVDFLEATLPLVVEVQSELYHAALVDRAHDAARRAQLEADGFVVVEVWDTDLWHRAERVQSIVQEGRRRARLAAERRRRGLPPL